MATISRTQMLMVATLVTATVLGGAYALGNTLGRPGGPLAPPDTQARHQTDAPAEGQGEPRSEHPGGRSPEGRNQAGSPRPPDTPARGRTAPPTATTRPVNPVPGATAQPGTDPDRTSAYGAARLPAEADGPFGARMTTGAGHVALTFDDGPDPRYTPQILDVLRDHHVKATFCLVGENAHAYPELVWAIATEGHTLCNHSWSHDVGLGSRSPATIWADLTRTNDAIRAAVPDARIAYFRQPGGNWTRSVVAAAQQLGMTSLHWTVDPQDWTVPGSRYIAAMVTASTTPGAIVLLHDGGGNRQGTVNAVYRMLPNLGRRFALAELPTGPPPPQPPTTQPSTTQPSATTPGDTKPGDTKPPGSTPPTTRPQATAPPTTRPQGGAPSTTRPQGGAPGPVSDAGVPPTGDGSPVGGTSSGPPARQPVRY